MSLEIRPRRDTDLAALGRVLVRVHSQDGYPVEGVADPIRWLTPPHQLAAWTALDQGQPVGHAALAQATMDDDAAQVWHEYTGASLDRLTLLTRLFVDPDHRGQGIGRMLMRTIHDHLHQQKKTLAFDVMLKDQAAIRLYEAAGYVRIGAITHHPQRRADRARRCLRRVGCVEVHLTPGARKQPGVTGTSRQRRSST